MVEICASWKATEGGGEGEGECEGEGEGEGESMEPGYRHMNRKIQGSIYLNILPTIIIDGNCMI